jgi:hypothetical protein
MISNLFVGISLVDPNSTSIYFKVFFLKSALMNTAERRKTLYLHSAGPLSNINILHKKILFTETFISYEVPASFHSE